MFFLFPKNTIVNKNLHWDSESAFICKMGFFFKMCFYFQTVKGFVSVVFPFSRKHNCKQKYVHSLQIALLMRLWTNNKIYINLLNLFQCHFLYEMIILHEVKSIATDISWALLFTKQQMVIKKLITQFANDSWIDKPAWKRKRWNTLWLHLPNGPEDLL